MSWALLTSGDAYKSPAFIALVSAVCVGVLLLLHHCVVVACCHGAGNGGDSRRRRRQQRHPRHGNGGVTSADARRRQQQGGEEDDEEEDEDEEAGASADGSATSRTHLVAAAVVCRYRKAEAWNESTCPVCLADFADGEPVRVLPECMHYYHAECIDTWLRGSTSCPMCRAQTTPTPTTTPSPGSVRHHLEVSVSLEEILVRT